jgi:sulfate/thiosulfate transport system substrate-binding protein
MRASRPTRGRHLTALLAGTALVMVCVAACSSSGPTHDGSTGRLALVAYSVPKPAYDALESAFAVTAAGKGTSWAASYGPSGAQAQAVLNGQRADYVAFSLEPDLTKLVPTFVDKTWNKGATKGLVSDSVVVIAVRKGNPKGIHSWADLVKPGVRIVTPDPGSSGSAKWNILAAYAHVLQDGGSDDDAQTYLKDFFAHVVSRPASGSNATSAFLNGTGDALISYENEAIAARQKGQALDYVVPDESLLIENPAAVTRTAPEAAKEFLAFVHSAAGQRIFADHGYRPVLAGVQSGPVAGANDPAHPFPVVRKLETIAELGGWTAVNKKFFDKNTGIVTKIASGQG